ncbi:MAG TPA: hypothetical protein VGR30_07355 [Candidatus Binatia bacterium]|jgi:hypothetical protein|nr:hypothetical protein [Candidatus Binatia bacterium]
MQTINSSEGRWSISLCNCSQDTVHFTYGNATLHILVEDLQDLGMAIEKMAKDLKSQDKSDGQKKDLLQ